MSRRACTWVLLLPPAGQVTTPVDKLRARPAFTQNRETSSQGANAGGGRQSNAHASEKRSGLPPDQR